MWVKDVKLWIRVTIYQFLCRWIGACLRCAVQDLTDIGPRIDAMKEPCWGPSAHDATASRTICAKKLRAL